MTPCPMAVQSRTNGLDFIILMTVDWLTGFALAFVAQTLGGARRMTSNRVTSLWNAAEESSVR